MKPFFEETETSYRALLSNAEDVFAERENAEVIATRWYDTEPPLDQLIMKAKELNKDVITIEEQILTQRSYNLSD